MTKAKVEKVRVRLCKKLEKTYRPMEKDTDSEGVVRVTPARGRQLHDSLSGVTIFPGNPGYDAKMGQEVPLTANVKAWLKSDLLVKVEDEPKAKTASDKKK